MLERQGITPVPALCLLRYFGGEEADAVDWIHMQATYDFKVAQKTVGKAIAKGVKPRDEIAPPPLATTNDSRSPRAP